MMSWLFNGVFCHPPSSPNSMKCRWCLKSIWNIYHGLGLFIHSEGSSPHKTRSLHLVGRKSGISHCAVWPTCVFGLVIIHFLSCSNVFCLILSRQLASKGTVHLKKRNSTPVSSHQHTDESNIRFVSILHRTFWSFVAVQPCRVLLSSSSLFVPRSTLHAEGDGQSVLFRSFLQAEVPADRSP